jgi:hypothetical protein
MTVVRNEMESGENNPSGVLSRRTIGAAYSWHNYGKSTIGARCGRGEREHRASPGVLPPHYQPDNAVLIVTGKFDEAKTLARVAQLFGPIPRPARRLEPTYTVDPEQQGERSVTVRRVGEVQLVQAVYHVPAGPHPDFAAVQLLTLILGTAPRAACTRRWWRPGRRPASSPPPFLPRAQRFSPARRFPYRLARQRARHPDLGRGRHRQGSDHRGRGPGARRRSTCATSS